MFERISALRARIQSIGTPSEHALYARRSSDRLQRTMQVPDSAKVRLKLSGDLQQDSALIIRKNIYSSSRF